MLSCSCCRYCYCCCHWHSTTTEAVKDLGLPEDFATGLEDQPFVVAVAAAAAAGGAFGELMLAYSTAAAAAEAVGTKAAAMHCCYQLVAAPVVVVVVPRSLGLARASRVKAVDFPGEATTTFAAGGPVVRGGSWRACDSVP